MALRRALVAPGTPKRAEPDKSAMGAGAAPFLPTPAAGKRDMAAPPPNLDSVMLRRTARPIDEIIVHCTATPEGKDYTVADVRQWHKARGWSDIGYHYVVYRDGRVMEGRPVGQIGAHCEGHNTGTIGIAYIGGLTGDGKAAKDTRTSAQRASLLWLTRALTGLHGSIKRLSGHNQYAPKACPSFDVRRDRLFSAPFEKTTA
jgi:N-acetylmuramoyl-L-alanine amidase